MHHKKYDEHGNSSRHTSLYIHLFVELEISCSILILIKKNCKPYINQKELLALYFVLGMEYT